MFQSFIKSSQEINESHIGGAVDAYAAKYEDQVAAYENHSIRTNLNESVSSFEVLALGQQLDQYSAYEQFVNESFSGLQSLGTIPQVALDVITSSTGGSILPIIASIQPIPDEHNIVYYKQIKSTGANGGYTAGEVIRDPLTIDNLGDGSLGSQRKQSDTTLTAATTLSLTLGTVPVRPYTIKIMRMTAGGATTTTTGQDDGSGVVIGFGVQGSINYATGAVSLTFAEAPTAGDILRVIFDVDSDLTTSVDKIEGSLLTKNVQAEAWTLASDFGLFSSFAFGQRFGRVAADEIASDLAVEMTAVLNQQAVRRLMANTNGNTDWPRVAPTGVSYAEHKLTFIDAFSDAEAEIHDNSGANTISVMIAGKTAASKLAGMPEWTKVAANTTDNVSLYGIWDGIPVVRANNLVDDDQIVCLANPQNYFNAPLAYCPYMPLVMTDTIQSPNNPFKSTRAAGIWSGMTILNDNLITRLTMTTS